MDNILGLIGLAKRAGAVTTGEPICTEKIRKKAAKLVILADDASDNTKKSVINSCNYYKVPYVVFSSKDELGNYTGGGFKSVISINDRNFAKSICNKINTSLRKD